MAGFRICRSRNLVQPDDIRTNNEEIGDRLSAVSVNHRPEVSCDGVGHDRRTDVLNRQFADAQAKLIAFLLVAGYSAHCGFPSERKLGLDATEYLAAICTVQVHVIGT